MAFNITSSPTNAEILANLLGDTTGLSNIQITTNGNPLAVGLFQDSPLNLSSGVVLSNGQADRLVGFNANDQNNVSTVFNGPGTVANGNDAITLEITFDTDAVGRQLFLQYVFGSEEFLDFAGNSFNDRLTFELNGVNLAKLNNGKPVEVNSLTPSNDPTTFSPDYITNLSNANPAYYQTVLDGYTVPLTIQGDLLPNAKNRLVITIQDIGDGAVDSAVFLSGRSLGVSNPIPFIKLNVDAPRRVDEDGVTSITYTFTRTGATDKTLSVNYRLDGTATFDTDYTFGNGQNGTIVFPAGSASTTLTVTPKIDDLVEGDELVSVQILPASNAEYNFSLDVNSSALGFILDQDTPLNNISLTVSPEQVVENLSGNLIYTFTRTGPTTESLRVDYNVGGTAIHQEDYDVYAVGGKSTFQGSVGSITFDEGVSTVILSVDPRPDFIIEPLETVALTLTPSRYDPQLGRSRSYNIDTPSAVVGGIVDSPIIPPDISLFVQPGIVGENSGTNLSYFFSRTGSTTSPLTVQYFVRGTAALGTDYTVTGAASFDDTVGTVTFQAGSNFAVVDIIPTPDSVIEPTETVILQLDTIAGANGGYTVNTFTEVVGLIADATTPIINLILEPQIVIEGGTTHLFYDFSRSGSTNDALTVNYSIGGDATFGADYNQTGASSFNSAAGSIIFAAGSNTARLEITSLIDDINESTESIALTLTDSKTYAIGNNSFANGFITDVPIISTVNLALNRASVNEGGTDNLSYTFTRTGGIDQVLNVRYQIKGTAINDTDYSTLGTSTVDPNDINVRTFDFAPGASTYTVRVDPTSDTLLEGDETVSLELLPALIGLGYGRYTFGTSSAATGVIAEANVSLPVIEVTLSSASVVEGGQNLVYLFTRTGSVTQPLTIDYNIGGTAAFTTDYNQTGANSFTNTTGSITFAANSATATLSITPVTDAIVEPDETVTLNLVGNSNYTIGSNSSASGTIVDVPPVVVVTPPIVSLAVNPASVNEDGTANLVYTFTRSGSTQDPLVVTYRVGGTATAGTDYFSSNPIVGATSTVAFNAGSSTATVVIDPGSDTLVEGDETVSLNLLPAGNNQYTVGTTAAVTGTILDQDTALNNVSLTVAPTQVAEDGTQNLIYTFTRTGPTNEALRVDYDFGGTAAFGNDYAVIGANSLRSIPSGVATLNIGTVNFAVGSDTVSLTIDPTSDSLVEADENVTLRLVSLRSDSLTGGGRVYNISTPDAIGGVIADATPTVTVGLNPSVVNENGTTNLIYTFTRTGSLTNSLNVTYSVAGTATNNVDYSFTGTPTLGTITFAAGSNTAQLVIDPTADVIQETSETVEVKLTVPTSGIYTVATSDVLVGTITDPVVDQPDGLNFIGTTNLDVSPINNLSNGVFAVNPNNVNLVGDEINLVGGANSVTVPGKRITLQPDRPTQSIQIGSVNSNSPDILDLIPSDLAAIADGFSKIVIGRANGTGNIDISSNVTFRDPILLQSPGGQLNITAPIILTDDATLDFNVKTLAKSGSSALTINGNTATTFIGNTLINGGVLLLAKSANTEALNNAPITVNSGVLQLGNNEQINNAADLTLNGGTLNLSGFNETLDQLQVTSNSTINLGNGSSKLAFGNSSTANWTGILSIENWSSTSGESIRFGNSATGLTATQLSNIQFVGFSRGASINASGFIAPTGSTVTNPTPDQDGVNDDIEDLAPNGGDGNLDGILDSLQENVVSILNLGGVNVNNIATVIAKAGAKISGLRSLANPITTANLTSLANPIEFKVTGLTNGAATTVEYLIAKADQTRNYNTYLMFGATTDNRTPHVYEFLYDGQTGAELFDTNGDGFTDKAIVHFVDGLRGDSDLIVNGEIQDPGAPGVSSTPVGLSTDVNNVVQVTGSAGTAIAKFSLVANQTKKVNEVGFFKIDGTNKVKGIAANATGFAQAALQSGQVIFSSLADNLLSNADISRQLQLSAGDRLGFYLVQNGTVDAALQKNDFSNVVFSLDPANPAGKKALEVTTESNGSYRLKWEQGSAEVNDDLILNLQLQNTPLNNQNLVAGIQGDKESELLDLSSFTGQNIQVNFTIKREAAYNDTVGFYKIEDAQGTVMSITGAKLKPGEAGYQAAVVQNRIVGIDLEGANGQTVLIDKVLQGGAIYAPFLIANANASNLNGNFSNVYTPYTLGNSDTTDHVRLLGDNTFGFEDLVGGGDKDFNDVVLKAVFKNS